MSFTARTPVHCFRRNNCQSFLSDSHSTLQPFTTTPTLHPCCCGDGISFLITPIGSIQDSLELLSFAVKLNSNNRISIEMDPASFALVDAMRNGVKLKSGKRVTFWIEYDHDHIKIWVGYTLMKSQMPILAAPVDLSK
ncbi:hypothetical protein L2E82_47362 [Cichorium intybus]|uniref:Uncharacterized protein n=1 Tax=Cichorium intybus TaxID=13427 RepID=A0ACB8YVD9_CICIN|nr:hypothetical protein L2E82_47362 [Cichorium intybus]